MTLRDWLPETREEWLDDIATCFLAFMTVLFFGSALLQILTM